MLFGRGSVRCRTIKTVRNYGLNRTSTYLCQSRVHLVHLHTDIRSLGQRSEVYDAVQLCSMVQFVSTHRLCRRCTYSLDHCQHTLRCRDQCQQVSTSDLLHGSGTSDRTPLALVNSTRCRQVAMPQQDDRMQTVYVPVTSTLPSLSRSKTDDSSVLAPKLDNTASRSLVSTAPSPSKSAHTAGRRASSIHCGGGGGGSQNPHAKSHLSTVASATKPEILV